MTEGVSFSWGHKGSCSGPWVRHMCSLIPPVEWNLVKVQQSGLCLGQGCSGGDISGPVGVCNWGSRGLQTGDLEAPPYSRWGWIRLTVGVVGGWMLPGLGKEGMTEGQLLPQRLSVGGQSSGAHQAADGAGSG